MEGMIHAEITDLIRSLKEESASSGDGGVRISQKFYLYVVNALWTIMSGRRLEHDDPKLATFASNLHFLDEGSISLVSISPSLRHVIPELSGWMPMVRTMKFFRDMMTETIKEHVEARSKKEDPEDYIDVYLDKVLHLPEE